MLTARQIADAVLSGRPIEAEELAPSASLSISDGGAVELKLCEGFGCGRNFVRLAMGPKESRKRICPKCEAKSSEKKQQPCAW